MRIARPLLFLTVGTVAVVGPSCSSATTTPPSTTNTTNTNTIVFEMSVPAPAQRELYQCQFVKMPDTGGEVFVSGGTYTTTPGTHHFLMFRTAPDMTAPPALNAPVDCFEGQGVMQYERGFVTGGQVRTESADFPEGAALAFKPGEVLLFQGHFVNAGAQEVQAKIHVEMRSTAAETVKWRVGTYRFYNPFIYLPPGAHAPATASMRCHIHHDVTILSAGSHMHKRGVAYRAYFDTAGGPPADNPFFTTNDWQSPPYWRGPLTIPAGSAIRFFCDYQNDGDQPIIQGLSADNNEMCMFSAFYIPESDSDDDDCVSMDMHGTGTRTCAETNSCLLQCSPSDEPNFGSGKADVGECWQKCITESCPNVTETLFPQQICTQKNCATECAQFGPSCTSCVIAKCKAELDACQALECKN
jgi:hypothetical protein